MANIAHGACPECGGNLVVDTEARVSRTIHRWHQSAMPTLDEESVPTTVAFCSSCEFSHEVEGL